MNKIKNSTKYEEHDPNSFESKCNKIALLVYGYTREIKSTLNIRYIPADMIEIIIQYYPTQYSILSIGRNLFGEFGLNEETENNNQYVKLLRLSSLCCNHKEIYCGFFTFTVRTEHNEFYGCGNNCDGQLGVNKKEYNIKQFHKIHNNNIISPIKIFSDGPFAWHRVFVTENNNFYGCGRNKNSTLGLDAYPDKNYEPIALYNLTQLFTHTLEYEIISIKCGASHTLFLCSNGKLFSVGENGHGQCGHVHINVLTNGYDNDTCTIKQPMEVRNIPFIIDISVGEYFSLCISQKRNLWVFGSNNNYQLGVSNSNNNQNHKQLLLMQLHMNMTMDDYDYETDSDSELDAYDEDDEDNVDVLVPTLNTYFSSQNIKIDKIRCGESHSLVICKNGYCYCCGQNTHGESLGKYRRLKNAYGVGGVGKCESYDPICFQSVVRNYNINDVKDDDEILIEDGSCGNTHTMLLIKDRNEIYGFGANDHGQVAVACKETKIHKPYLLTKSQIGIHEDNHIERVIAGCYTTLIVCNKL